MIETRSAQAQSDGLHIEMRLDYLEMNDASTFEVLEPQIRKGDVELVILSGALNVDKTRLIDNILLGNTQKILGW